MQGLAVLVGDGVLEGVPEGHPVPLELLECVAVLQGVGDVDALALPTVIVWVGVVELHGEALGEEVEVGKRREGVEAEVRVPQGVEEREALGEREEVLDPESDVLGEGEPPVGDIVEVGVLPPPPLPPTPPPAPPPSHPGGEIEEDREGVGEAVEVEDTLPLPLGAAVEVGARGVCDTLPVVEMEGV